MFISQVQKWSPVQSSHRETVPSAVIAERGGMQVGDEVERLDQESVIGWSVSQFLDNLPDLQLRAAGSGRQRSTEENRFELSVRRGPQLRDEVLVCGEQLIWQDTRKNQPVELGESEEEDEASTLTRSPFCIVSRAHLQ